MRRFISGTSACVGLVGSSKTPKRSMMEDLVNISCDVLFQLLQQKCHDCDSGNAFEVHTSYYEIFDEQITDLLNPQNVNLLVQEHPVLGVIVKDAARRIVGDSLSLKALFEEGCLNRNSSFNDFGPASQQAALIFQVDLVQTEPDTTMPSGQRHVHSRILFVELPGTEKLAESRSTLVAREGPTLNRGILALQTVCNSAESDRASFQDSVLTQLLVEPLGGNCNTTFLVMLNQDPAESNSTSATLQLADTMTQIKTYPNQNHDCFQGIVKRYRVAIHDMLEEIATVKDGAAERAAALEDDGVVMKLHELQGRVVKDNLENFELKEGKQQIHRQLIEFRERYNQLVGSKQELQASLIAAEEDKLKLSKALLDLQIDHSQQAEQHEQQKYDIMTKLLNAENSILELELKEQNRERAERNDGEQLAAALQEKKELAVEFVSLRSNCVNLQKSFKEERQKNQELGVELLTLVNQRNALDEKNKQLEADNGALKSKHNEMGRQLGELQAETAILIEQLREQKSVAEEMRTEKVRIELEFQRAGVEFDIKKLELDQNTQEFSRERDAALQGIKRATEAEMKRAETEKDEYKEHVKTLEIQYRQQQRRIVELQTALQRKTEEGLAAASSTTNLQAKIGTLAENYRVKLLQYIRDEDESEDSDNRSKQQRILQELLGTYQQNERDLTAKTEMLRQKHHDVLRKNRLLYEKFKEIRYQLEDYSPGSQVPDLPDENELRSGDPSELEQEMERDCVQLREKVRHFQGELSIQQEKALQDAEAHRRNMESFQKQVPELTGQVGRLNAEKQQLQAELSAASQGRQDGQSHAYMKQMQELQQTLMSQIDELRQTRAQPVAAPPPPPGPAQDRPELLRELEKLHKWKHDAENSALQAPKRAEHDHSEVKALKETLEDLSNKLKEARGGTSAGLADQLVTVEKRCAQLMSKNAAYAEEIEGYKVFMDMQRQKIQKLKAKAKEAS